jgi:hypothetical protein
MFCFKQVMIGTSKNIWGFDPRSVPGCVVWLDAADTSTLTLSGTNITAWRDKSIYGNNVNSISPTPPTYNSADSSVNFVATSGTFLRGTMSQIYSNSASVFVVASIATQPSPVYFPRISLLGSSATANSQLIGQFLIVDGSNPRVFTYLSTNTNPAGLGTNVMTGVSNVTYNTRQLITNVSSYIGTTYTISTFLNGDAQNTSVSTRTGTFTASGTNVAIYNKYSLANYLDAASTGGDSYSGKIFEYLVFNDVLTASQRQQIEGYLTWKWGLSGFSTIPSPLSVPGCVLWLDASDASTITRSGSSITQWNDKSGTGNNMTPFSTFSNATVSSNFQNNRDVIDFSANGVYRGPTSTGPYPVDVYLVMALKNTTTHADVITVHSSNSPSSFNSLTFGEYTASRWHNGSEGFARTPNAVSPSNETSTAFLLINWSVANSNYLIRRNGVVITQTTSYTFTRPADSRFQIGFRVNPAAFSPATTAGTFRGYIGEIVAFNSQLGYEQRRQVESYLGFKWGLSSAVSVLPSIHPYVSLRPQLRTFQPTDIAGCRLWLDAADQSTLTLQSNNKVSAWKDKSINAFVLSNATTLTQPTYVTSGWNGSYPAVQVNGSGSGQFNFLSNAAFNGFNTTTWDIYAVVKHSRNSFEAGIMWIDPSASFIIVSAAAGTSQFVYTNLSNGNWVFGPVTGSTTTQSPYIFQNYSTGTTLGRRLNGVQPGLTEQIVAFNWTAKTGTYPLCLANPSTGWSQPTTFFAEMLMFSRTLSTSERLQIEGYLSTKWGLTQTSFSSTAFTPTSIGGCQLWFDASDTASLTPSSITTGTKVSQWNDKSGNNRHMSNSTAATQPTYSTSNFNGSLPCVFFTGSTQASTNASILSNAASTVLNSTTWDMYVAFKPIGGQEAIFWNDPTGAVVLICGNTKVYDANYSIHYGGWRLAPNDGACRGGECQTFQAYSTGTTLGKRVNGGLEGGQTQTSSFSWPSRSSNSQLSFCRPSSGPWSEGNLAIAEVIVYNSVLSDANRSNVETYLTNKWKIGRGLQLGHPYYSFPSSTVTRPNFLELPYTPTNNNLFLAKYSSDGSVLWALRHVTPNGVITRDMATDSSGNLYISAYYEGALTVYNINGTVATTKANAGSQDGYLAKYSSQGNLLWMARNAATAGNYGVGVAVDLSGNVYLGGTYQPSLTLYNPAETSNIQLTSNAGQTDGFLAKYSPDGNPLWVARTAGTSYDSGGISVKTDSVGDVYSLGINVYAAVTFYNANGTTGGSLSFTGSTTEATWLAKWNSSGTFQWALRFVTNDLNSSAGGLSIDSNANLYVTSAYNATMTLRNTADTVVATLSNAGSYDAFIASYTSAGAYRWHARIIGTGSSDLVAHTGSSNGDQYVLGWYTGTITIYTSGEASSNTLTNSGSYDLFLIKYSSAGVLQWSTRIGSVNNDISYMPSVDPNGNVYVTGRYEGTCTFFNVGGGIGATLSNITSPDVFLAKYTTNGQLIWATRIAGTGGDYEGAMAADRNGDVFVSGFYQSSPLTFYGV